MREHEIYNSEEEVVETKKKSCNIKNYLTLNFLPYILSFLGLFLGLINRTVAWFSYSSIAVGVLFFLSFGAALSAFAISIFNIIKNKDSRLTVQLAVSIIAMAIIAILI